MFFIVIRFTGPSWPVCFIMGSSPSRWLLTSASRGVCSDGPLSVAFSSLCHGPDEFGPNRWWLSIFSSSVRLGLHFSSVRAFRSAT